MDLFKPTAKIYSRGHKINLFCILGGLSMYYDFYMSKQISQIIQMNFKNEGG
jgi:hypothetical protein